MNYSGKFLILLGVLLIIMGSFFMLGGKIAWLGRLPGDIIISKKNFSFYFPITTCVIMSIILSAIFFPFFKR